MGLLRTMKWSTHLHRHDVHHDHAHEPGVPTGSHTRTGTSMLRSATATTTLIFTTAIDIESSAGSTATRFPPRVILAVVAAVVFAALAVWAFVRLPYVGGLAPTSWRRLLAVVVAAFFALLSAWVVFILPAYWD